MERYRIEVPTQAERTQRSLNPHWYDRLVTWWEEWLEAWHYVEAERRHHKEQKRNSK